ncbi:MFS transporter [Streptomyces sp. NBC_00820]|uniref:MFS transporter n=1 Tax=Streptomyces sp. NBC_00820 TaxID=2975842 RepID=UPI002ED1ED1E|nr:MFS transporter [Streptomyces sp. NBC_00820]
MTTGSQDAADGFAFDARAWTRLLVLCGAILFEGMSLSSINVQLAGIQRTLGLPPDRLQLVASSFLTVYAALLLVGGKCADQWGHRRMFLMGVGVFGAGSLGAALSQEAVLLVTARAVQGVGAAITAPAAVALIIRGFPEGAARNRALGVLSAMGAAGFSLGVVMGGLLTQGVGWRGAFLLYVPLSLVILLVGVRVLDRETGTKAPRSRVLWLPALLFVGGLIAVVYALGRTGTGSLTEIVAVTAVGSLAIAAFFVVQAGSRTPLLPLGLVADRRMAAACLALGGAFAAITGAMFLVATDLQEHRGYSALAAGLAFLPQGVAVGLLSAPAARLADRRPAPRLLLSGLAVITAGQLLYTSVEHGGYATHLLPAALLVGSGIAVAYPASVMLAGEAASLADQGTASGFLVTCQQAGGALGVAAVTGIQSTAPGTFWAGPYSLWGCFAFAAASLLGCVVLLLPGNGRAYGARSGTPAVETAAERT